MISVPAIKIRKGMTIVTKKGSYVALRRLGDGKVQFESTRDGELLQLDDHSIALMLLRGELRFELSAELPAKAGAGPTTPLSGLAEAEASVASYRYRIAKAFVDTGLPRNMDNARAFLAELPAETGDGGSRPEWRNLLRWVAAIGKYPDAQALALAPRHARKGTRGPRIDPRVEAVIQGAIDEVWMRTARLTLADVYTAVSARLLTLQDAGEELSIPAASTVALRMQGRGKYERILRRLGRKAADRALKPAGSYPEPDRPMQVAEMDHTPADVFVWDDERLRYVAARAYITMLIDVYSRCVLGIHVSFDPPSYVSVMHCLFQAFLPKDDILEKYGLPAGSLPCCGLVEGVVLDNAREFHSTSFDRALGLLGVQSFYAKVSTPQDKAHVERMCGTVNRAVCHKMAGSTFSNVRQRGEEDPRKQAVHDISFLRKSIFGFLSLYHRRPHSQTGEAPARRWLEGTQRAPVTLPANANDLRILLCPSETRTLRRGGTIQIDRLDYWAPGLAAMLSREREDTLEIEVRIDTDDVGHVWAFDPKEETFILANCLQPDYANGLPRFVHRNILRDRNARVARGKRDPELIRDADDFRKQVTSGHRKGNPKKADVRKAGRVLEGTLKAVAAGKLKGSAPAYAVRASLPGEASVSADGWPVTATPGPEPPDVRAPAARPAPSVPVGAVPAGRAASGKPRKVPPAPAADTGDDWQVDRYEPVRKRPSTDKETIR
jgi:putative transposase